MWIKLVKTESEILTEAINELHQAVQIVASFPRSFLETSKNDENANLGWDLKSQTMKTKSFGSKKNIQLALNLKKYQIEIVTEDMVFDAFSLEGRTVGNLVELIKNSLVGLQVDVSSFSLELPYNLDTIQFSTDHKFNSIDTIALKALSNFYHSARISFQKTIENEFTKKHSIRIWPHHFDIAFSYASNKENFITVGMSPGDNNYDEPYYYTSIWPGIKGENVKKYQPIVGFWHTKSWSGLVLMSNDFILENEYLEERIILDFLKNAIHIARKLAE